MKHELNILFRQNADEQIERENKFKERFIKWNDIQIRRNEELIRALGGKEKNRYAIHESESQRINMPEISNNHRGSNHTTLEKEQINDHDETDNYYWDKTQSKSDLEVLRRKQYRKVLDSQIKQRQSSYDNFAKVGERNPRDTGLIKSFQSRMAMIPGINSTSSFVSENHLKKNDQALDEHRRKMK